MSNELITKELTVVGMSCGHCVSSVKNELSAVPGVKAVEVTLSSGKVVVKAESVVSDSALIAAVQEAGYSVAGA